MSHHDPRHMPRVDRHKGNNHIAPRNCPALEDGGMGRAATTARTDDFRSCEQGTEAIPGSSAPYINGPPSWSIDSLAGTAAVAEYAEMSANRLRPQKGSSRSLHIWDGAVSGSFRARRRDLVCLSANRPTFKNFGSSSSALNTNILNDVNTNTPRLVQLSINYLCHGKQHLFPFSPFRDDKIYNRQTESLTSRELTLL